MLLIIDSNSFWYQQILVLEINGTINSSNKLVLSGNGTGNISGTKDYCH